MGFRDTHHEGRAAFPVEHVASWVLRWALSTVLLLGLFFTAAGCDVATDLFGSEESVATGGTDSDGTDSGGTDSGGTDSDGTDSGGTDSGGTDPVFSVDLYWDPPTKNEDGTLLDDLAGYKVYDGPAAEQYETVTDVGDATQVTLHDLPAGTYYMTVTAYDLDGNESGFSNEIVVVLE